MKKGLIILIALFAMFFIAGQAMADIINSAHDLRTDLGITEICVVCHVPHNAETGVTTPLWNRADHSSTVFTTAGDLSNACLSCHDGTEALDNYGGTTTGTQYVTGTALFDSAAGHHPVGAPIPATAEYNDPPTGTDVPDLGGVVECASCHDVHDDTEVPFLVGSNTASAICTACHNK